MKPEEQDAAHSFEKIKNDNSERFFNNLRIKMIVSKRKTLPSLKVQAIVFGLCWFVLLVLITIAINIKNYG